MGPLHGVRVVEVGSIGPGPFAAMVLADLGADVIRLERPARAALLDGGGADLVNRGRPTVPIDLKDPEDVEVALSLIDRADALIEGNRPGVAERLGIGPEDTMARNPRLVYGRMTGYGQDGPLADVVGHDINYVAMSGALGAIAREGERPLFPLNLLGDYGGGGMLLALGIVCGVLEAKTSGKGQVVDAAMVDGVALLSTAIHGLRATGGWSDVPGTNVLDSGAHFYDVYETADGLYMAVGAIEPQFYAALLDVLELDAEDYPQWQRSSWPQFKSAFTAIFKARTRDEWEAAFVGTDACVTPVLRMGEAIGHPHVRQRGTLVEVDGVVQPGTAPRFSRTPADRVPRSPRLEDVLRGWSVSPELTARFATMCHTSKKCE